jgi:hypothetical protein
VDGYACDKEDARLAASADGEEIGAGALHGQVPGDADVVAGGGSIE